MKTRFSPLASCPLWIAAAILLFSAPFTLAAGPTDVPAELIRQSDENLDYIPGLIVVKYADSSSKESVEATHAFIGPGALAFPGLKRVRSVMEHGLDRIFVYTLPENVDVRRLAEGLSARPGVEYAEPNLIRHLSSAPNDSLFNDQYALNNTGQPPVYGTPDADIDYPEALDLATGSGAIIAMIDSGVDIDHPDLINSFWVNPGEDINHNGVADWYPASEGGDLNGIDDDGNCQGYVASPFTNCIDDLIGYDFVYTASGLTCAPGEDCSQVDEDVSDAMGHGSSTAGVAAASTNNGIGIAGACPGCRLMILRACYKTTTQDACGTIYAAWSIAYAIEMGANVISMSFGGPASSYVEESAIAAAHAAGLVAVAGAGNNGDQTPQYPAAFPHVIATAMLDQFDKLAIPISSFGDWVDISAHGFNIRTTNYIGGYTYFGGTSAATPFVSGVAGMLLNAHPALTPDAVEAALKQGADNIDAINPSYVGLMGAGRLNAYNSLCLLIPTVTVVEPSGGKILGTGNVCDVQWMIPPCKGVGLDRLEYSLDNAETWDLLADSLGEVSSYAWTVPNVPSDSVWVRAIVSDTSSGEVDTCDAPFRIVDDDAPAVFIGAPAGGEDLVAGEEITVNWGATDNVAVVSACLEFSSDNGQNWAPVECDTLTAPYQWTVADVSADSARVRVTCADGAGNEGVATSSAFTIIQVSTGVEGGDLPNPKHLLLLPTFPNPMVGSTTFRFYLPEAQDVQVGIYDVQGRHVVTLLQGWADAGWQQLSWNGASEVASRVSPGVYFCAVHTRDRTTVRRMTVLN